MAGYRGGWWVTLASGGRWGRENNWHTHVPAAPRVRELRRERKAAQQAVWHVIWWGEYIYDVWLWCERRGDSLVQCAFYKLIWVCSMALFIWVWCQALTPSLTIITCKALNACMWSSGIYAIDAFHYSPWCILQLVFFFLLSSLLHLSWVLSLVWKISHYEERM